MAASRILEPLCVQEDVTSPSLRSAVARIYLQSGNLALAINHFDAVAVDPTVDETTKNMNSALLAAAQGDWASATTTLRVLLENDEQNFAVCFRVSSQGSAFS